MKATFTEDLQVFKHCTKHLYQWSQVIIARQVFLGWDPRSLQTQICMQECLAGQGVVKGKLKMNICGEGKAAGLSRGKWSPPSMKTEGQCSHNRGLPQPTPGALELSPPASRWQAFTPLTWTQPTSREQAWPWIRQLSGWGPFLRRTQLPTLPEARGWRLILKRHIFTVAQHLLHKLWSNPHSRNECVATEKLNHQCKTWFGVAMWHSFFQNSFPNGGDRGWESWVASSTQWTQV